MSASGRRNAQNPALAQPAGQPSTAPTTTLATLPPQPTELAVGFLATIFTQHVPVAGETEHRLDARMKSRSYHLPTLYNVYLDTLSLGPDTALLRPSDFWKLVCTPPLAPAASDPHTAAQMSTGLRKVVAIDEPGVSEPAEPLAAVEAGLSYWLTSTELDRIESSTTPAAAGPGEPSCSADDTTEHNRKLLAFFFSDERHLDELAAGVAQEARELESAMRALTESAAATEAMTAATPSPQLLNAVSATRRALLGVYSARAALIELHGSVAEQDRHRAQEYRLLCDAHKLSARAAACPPNSRPFARQASLVRLARQLEELSSTSPPRYPSPPKPTMPSTSTAAAEFAAVIQLLASDPVRVAEMLPNIAQGVQHLNALQLLTLELNLSDAPAWPAVAAAHIGLSMWVPDSWPSGAKLAKLAAAAFYGTPERAAAAIRTVSATATPEPSRSWSRGAGRNSDGHVVPWGTARLYPASPRPPRSVLRQIGSAGAHPQVCALAERRLGPCPLQPRCRSQKPAHPLLGLCGPARHPPPNLCPTCCVCKHASHETARATLVLCAPADAATRSHFLKFIYGLV